MRRSKAERKKKILVCNDHALMAAGEITQSLYQLQLLTRLLEMGFQLHGNALTVFRMEYDAELSEKIKEISKKRNGMIILFDQMKSEQEEKHFWKRKKIVIRELIAAACSDELFSVIDLKPISFEVLSGQKAEAIIEEMWKKK